MVLKKTFESPLDCKEIQPVNPEGNQSWIFIGGTDAEAETPILWTPDVKSWLLEKTLMLGKIEGGRRRGWQRMRWWDAITDSMDTSLSKLWAEGQGGLACCSPMGCKESNTTEWLNWTNIYFSQFWRVESPKSSQQHVKVSDKRQLPNSQWLGQSFFRSCRAACTLCFLTGDGTGAPCIGSMES